jgi:hypothetical protein
MPRTDGTGDTVDYREYPNRPGLEPVSTRFLLVTLMLAIVRPRSLAQVDKSDHLAW